MKKFPELLIIREMLRKPTARMVVVKRQTVVKAGGTWKRDVLIIVGGNVSQCSHKTNGSEVCLKSTKRNSM